MKKAETNMLNSLNENLSNDLKNKIDNLNKYNVYLPLDNDGNVEEPQDGTVEEPQVGNVEEPQNGTVEEPQDGNVEEPQDGSVEEPQVGSVEEPQDGSVEEPQVGSVEEPQDGNMDIDLEKLTLKELQQIARDNNITVKGPKKGFN